jgi:hypothetical protein
MPTRLALLLTAAGASIATTAAIALPAIGDDGKKPPAAGQHVAVEGPRPTELRTCLKNKGLNPPADDAELKRWIGEQINAGKGDIIKGCFIAVDGKKPGDGADTRKTELEKKNADDRPGPSFDDLRTCLTGKGFDVPDDPFALKQWLGPHIEANDAAGKAAAACFESLPPKPPAEYGPGEKARFGTKDYRKSS